MTQGHQHQNPSSQRFLITVVRHPCIYCPLQIDQQRAYEVNNPAEYHDFGDRGLLRSCDSIESVDEARPEQHLRWLREANSDPYVGVGIELDALDRDILQPQVAQPASPRSQMAAEHEE